MEPLPATVEVQSPNHWTAREFPHWHILDLFFLFVTFSTSLFRLCYSLFPPDTDVSEILGIPMITLYSHTNLFQLLFSFEKKKKNL